MAAPRKLWRVKSNRSHARTKTSLIPSFLNVKTRFSPWKKIKTGVLRGYCGDRPRITGWLGLGPVREPFCPRRRRGPESLLRPTGARRTRPRSNSSSDVPKSRSTMHLSYCSPHSKHIKRKKTQNIPTKVVTTTLNAPQLLSWPH